MKMNKIKIALSCAVILFLIGGITTVIGFEIISPKPLPSRPTATIQMKFDPQSLTMKRGESKEITVILDCCSLRNEELGKIETVEIGMLVNGFTNTARIPGITTKFNQEYLTLKINQTAYLNLTISVDNTAEFGTHSLSIGLYNTNNTQDIYVYSQTLYSTNLINLTIIDIIPTAMPKTPAFDAFSVILALLAVPIIKRKVPTHFF